MLRIDCTRFSSRDAKGTCVPQLHSRHKATMAGGAALLATLGDDMTGAMADLAGDGNAGSGGTPAWDGYVPASVRAVRDVRALNANYQQRWNRYKNTQDDRNVSNVAEVRLLHNIIETLIFGNGNLIRGGEYDRITDLFHVCKYALEVRDEPGRYNEVAVYVARAANAAAPQLFLLLGLWLRLCTLWLHLRS